ncbi:MAG TPA: hypothetical protein VGK78_07290 [Nocardioides sp.]|uniref:hypothetical protein n=1 Tax=Nocardioides sp. TaxID=35761 RepID=UPI002F416D2A
MRFLRGAPWFAMPLGIFVLTRLFDAVVIVLMARHQIPASSLPRDALVPTVIDPPSYLSAIQSWDGQWYRQIVEHGYPSTLPTRDGEVTQNAWAFYPGYPALVWLVTRLGLSFGVAASAVSLVAGGAAMCLLYRLVRLRSSDWMAGVTVLAVCCAPMAPVLQVAYTESVALLLLLLGLWWLHHRRYGWVALVGLALALVRPVTLPLAVAVAVELALRWRRREREDFPARERAALIGAMITIAVSAVIWPLVAGIVVGDLSAYSDTQKAWRGTAGTRPDTWLVSLLHGAPPARWVFVVVVVAVAVWIGWRNRQWTDGTRAWVAAYPAYVLAATPPTSSLFRYLMLLGPGLWPFSKSEAIVREKRGLVVLGIVVLGLATQVLWLYWYFVITPGSRGTP